MSATVESILADLDMVAVGSDMERGVLDLAKAMLKAQGSRVAELETAAEETEAFIARNVDATTRLCRELDLAGARLRYVAPAISGEG